MHRNIDVMRSRDGIYVIVAVNGICLVEVVDGVAHQLDLKTYARDGELRTGSWLLHVLVAILGPFARTPFTTPTKV